MSARWLLLAAAVPLLGVDADFFEMKVRPVLARNCYGCHAPPNILGGLTMTSREQLLKGGAHGPALVPGDPAQSLLVKSIRYDDDVLKMPPTGRLADAEIDNLTAWVKSGAAWPEVPIAKSNYVIKPEHRAWWAFQPVRKAEPPAVKDPAWSKNPIDRFILARLEAEGLKPVAPAARLSLLRRAYFDLTGLPPSPEEIDAFLKDTSPNAFAKVVDRLLESPRYGERWGRYWLDIARYSDDRLNSTQDDPYKNAWRYRDWVIQAFNEDMPYDLFLKAQIAGDQLPDKEKLIAGLGFYALSPEFQDDRVDATTRGFMALTAACAQCHDHKFDPIPTKDYYALLGVFTSTKLEEYPLAPAAVVTEYKDREARIESQKKEMEEYLDKQANLLAGILAAQTARYLRAARKGAMEDGLDRETFERWQQYLAKTQREHPFLNDWDKDSFSPGKFQDRLLDVIQERKKIEETNFIRLGGSDKRGDLARADLLSLERDKYFLWRDFMGKDKFAKFDSGILYYKDGKIDRFLDGQWKQHLVSLRAELESRKKALPEQYPFFHIVKDVEQPKNQRIRIRGSLTNLGDEAPRAFMTILSGGDPKPFAKGSGRLELAEAVASPANPLTPRVMVNRIWMNHFGAPIVATPSNFGQLGEKPSHPELLDYLAARFVEQGWSIKTIHREIMLSRVYQLSAVNDGKNFTADPDNRLYWRANRRRLDIEPLRDTLLAVSGELDLAAGGQPVKITEEKNFRRTIYGFVSRRKLDGTLSLFDFPNPNSTSELRVQTATPLQQLFFLNSGFVEARAAALAKRLEPAGDDPARIRQAYRILYGRAPLPKEIELGAQFLKSEPNAWPKYAQALLGSNELLFVN